MAYSSTSLWGKTPTKDFYLDILQKPNLRAHSEDVLTTVTAVYENRPDLLAHDMYGDSNLWWVFALRNPNTFVDPLWDFTIGKQFYVPSKRYINQVLDLQ